MNMIKYEKIPHIDSVEGQLLLENPNDIIEIQEKVDGSNFRFKITDDDKIVMGSRSVQLTSDTGEFCNIEKPFRPVCLYIKEKVEPNISKLRKLLTGIDVDLKDLVFFGEAMIKHRIQYDWDSIPKFLGFDVYNEDMERFFSAPYRKELFWALGLESVKSLGMIPACEITDINDNNVPVSYYATKKNPELKAEGLVFKNIRKQIYAKYVRKGFKQRKLKGD